MKLLILDLSLCRSCLFKMNVHTKAKRSEGYMDVRPYLKLNKLNTVSWEPSQYIIFCVSVFNNFDIFIIRK